MDTETSEVIERINARIDALEVSLRAEIRGECASVRTDLRAEIRESLAENRRHTDVQFESVRDDIRMLAEAFATVSTKLDSLQR